MFDRFIAEILYIGICSEKGRCGEHLKKIGYRSILKKHIYALDQLQKSVYTNDPQKVKASLKMMAELCQEEREIGKFYYYLDMNENIIDAPVKFECINRLLSALFDELTEELSHVFLNRRNIYTILNVMHNLPRAYFNDPMSYHQSVGISEKEALQYTYDIMDGSMRKRYAEYFDFIIKA